MPTTLASTQRITAANGQELERLGVKTVRFISNEGVPFSLEFVVLDVGRPLLSVGRLVSRGFDLQFAGNGGAIVRGRHEIKFRREGTMFAFNARFALCESQPVVIDVDVETPSRGRAAETWPPPPTPTTAERAAHDITHIPFRSWCRVCVIGHVECQEYGSELDSLKSFDVCEEVPVSAVLERMRPSRATLVMCE